MLHADYSSALLFQCWIWHAARPPQHLSAIVVQKICDVLAVCLGLGARRASALVTVDLTEMVCCGIGEGLEQVPFRQGYCVSTLLG